MKLRCPLKKNYLPNGKTCVMNQLFGENKNSDWYGPNGHTGIDFMTLGTLKYRRDDKGWLKEPRSKYEKEGRIPVVACHPGAITPVLNVDKEKQGWGIFVTAEPEMEEETKVQYRTLYWHIETPWSSLAEFSGTTKTKTKETVVTGEIIAIAGDNGMSSGPHLHLEFQKRSFKSGKWSSWEIIDPLPYFCDVEVIYQLYNMPASTWFYQGKEIDRKTADKIKKTLLPVV